MKSIGNVVSPLIAGAFTAAVFATQKRCDLIVRFRKWIRWFELAPVQLGQLRTYMRGPCFWLGNTVPPRACQGEDKWDLAWGYSFFLVQAHRSELNLKFVGSVVGFGEQFKCHSLTPCDVGSPRNTGVLILVHGDPVHVDVVGRGLFVCEPRCSIAELSDRFSISQRVNSLHTDGVAPPLDTPLWALAKHKSLRIDIVGPAACQQPGIVKLLLRNETYKVVARKDMKIWDAIRTATPIRCSIDCTQIWDVKQKCFGLNHLQWYLLSVANFKSLSHQCLMILPRMVLCHFPLSPRLVNASLYSMDSGLGRRPHCC